MEHLLNGEVPNPDWKKLNRKATFKMEYSPASKKIYGLVKDMLVTFQDNLAGAIKKEDETQESYDALMKSKNAELDSCKQALTDASQEGAARGLNKNEAQAEVDDLKAQVEADKGFIADTEKSFKEKTEEFEERKKLRMGEIGAISEAISILRSDEARDTMHKSHTTLLLQIRQRGVKAQILRKQALVHQAFSAVRKAGEQAQDARLSDLALRILVSSSIKEDPDTSGGLNNKGIQEVIEAIDKMVERLGEDEKNDLDTKEECEKNREEKTADARKVSLEIDDATEEIARQNTKVEEQNVQIKIAEDAIVKFKEELKEATRQREDEKAEYETGKSADEDAVALIENAMNVLKTFYSENFGGLQIAKKSKQRPEVVAGEAPPPPPSTFEGSYGGAGGEQKGIQQILGLIKEDIEADIEKATTEEEAAVKAFEQMEKDIEASVKDEESAIADAKSVIADAESEVESQKALKKTKHESLTATIDEVQAAEPGCQFITINFKVRVANRQLEIDGLKKAKAILQGGEFSL